MNTNERNENLKRILEIRKELYTIANEFAINQEGLIGAEIHESCNRILKAHKWATDGYTKKDESLQISEWLMKQPFGYDVSV